MRIILLVLAPVFADLIGYNRSLNNIFAIKSNRGCSLSADNYKFSIALHMITIRTSDVGQAYRMAKKLLGQSTVKRAPRLSTYKNFMY